MSNSDERFWKLFFEVFESLPRQGPGNRACAERALNLCADLPSSPRVLDLGCGTGAQTMHLADLTSGTILAVDNHAPNIARLQETIAERELSDRIQAIAADMATLDQPPESFDLIWSEGALYNIGIGKALCMCRELLVPGGYLAFTNAVWQIPNPPEAIRSAFEQDYPDMGSVGLLEAMVRECGFEIEVHFTLPEEAWWTDFYTPMEHRIVALRETYAQDAEALAILDQLAEEPRMHERYGEFYAYEFVIARKPQP